MHLLDSMDVRPGSTIQLEVSLKSLKDIDIDDASRISEADWWRSNVSSCLWDDVVIRLHKGCRINRLITYPDMQTIRFLSVGK